MKKIYGLRQRNGQPVRQAWKDTQELKNGNRLKNINSITDKCKDNSIIHKYVDFI